MRVIMHYARNSYRTLSSYAESTLMKIDKVTFRPKSKRSQ